MIRCTLELIPGGVGEPEHLGIIEIANEIGTTLSTGGKRGDYRFWLYKKRKNVTHPHWCGTVRDFPRLSYHPWNLVRRILNELAERNGGTI